MATQRTLREEAKPVVTPADAKRRREMADLLMSQGQGPIRDTWSGLRVGVNALLGGIENKKASQAEAEGSRQRAAAYGQMLDSYGSGVASYGGAMAMASPGPSSSGNMFQGVQPAQNFAVSPEIRDGIVSTASALGIDPTDLATAISYETAGTFDPTKRGPTTQWGQHRGFIQFGEPQARQHGVDWNNPIGSQLGPDGAVASYLRSTGVKPGMGMLDIYSAINAGGVGRYNRSDANNGGAPGTVRDKVERQMSGHRSKALAMFQGYQPGGAADAINQMAAAPVPAPVQVASLDPSIGMESALGQGAMRANNRAEPRPTGGAFALPDSELDPESRARLEALRTPQDMSNVRPYTGPGAIAETPGYIYDEQGFRHNGVPEMPPIGQPSPSPSSSSPAVTSMQATAEPMGQPQPYQASQAPAPYDMPQSNNQALAQALMAGGGGSAPQVDNRQAEMARALLGNPWTQDLGEQMTMQLLQQRPQERWETISGPDGSIWQRNSQTGQLDQVQGAPKAENPFIRAGDSLYNSQTGEWVREPQGPQGLINAGDGRLYDPNERQWIMPPQTGQSGFRVASPEEANQYGAQAGQFGPDGRFYPNNPPSGMSIESDGQGGFRVVQGPGAGDAKPFTEGQAKDNVFTTRARGALPVLDQYAPRLTSVGQRALDYDPTGIVRGGLQDPEFQIAKTAGDEFLQAILRKDTGAAITTQEQELYGKTYLPQPGDSSEVQAYKAQARQRAVAAIEAGMSPAQMMAQERALSMSSTAQPAGQPLQHAPQQVMPNGLPLSVSPDASETEIPDVATEEEFRALPSGTQFRAPDGSIRRKP